MRTIELDDEQRAAVLAGLGCLLCTTRDPNYYGSVRRLIGKIKGMTETPPEARCNCAEIGPTTECDQCAARCNTCNIPLAHVSDDCQRDGCPR